MINKETIHNYDKKKLIKKLVSDPSRQYLKPEDVILDKRLSQNEKEKILENWRLDAEALIRAEDESMISDNLANKPAKMIQKIDCELEKIKSIKDKNE